MRRCFRLKVVLAVVAGLVPSGALADQQLGDWTLTGHVEAGGRMITGNGWDSPAYRAYRDQDPGFIGNGSFLLDDGRFYLRGGLENLGDGNDSYRLRVGRWGHFSLGLEYSELPQVYSDSARTFYGQQGSQVIRLIDPTVANPVSLEFQSRRGKADVELSLLPSLDLFASYRIQDRSGTQPWAIGFGNPGDAFVNFARPVDDQTHEVEAGIRWAQDGMNLELSYTGSFYQNDLQKLMVDNFPTASTFGVASLGQTSLFPDNAAHNIRFTGGITLPIEMPVHLTGTFAYGRHTQDEDFLCHTVNSGVTASASAQVPCPSVNPMPVAGQFQLPRNSLDGLVETLLGDVVLTMRPTHALRVKARYRIYDYDNQTSPIVFPDAVEMDAFGQMEQRVTTPNDYTRQNADLDLTYRFSEMFSAHGGAFWEGWNRSHEREVTRQNETGGRVGLRVKPGSWARVDADYEHSIRRSNGYDPFAYSLASFDIAETDPVRASELNQMVFSRMRKYDLADRTWDRFDARAWLNPCDAFSLTFTGSWSQADYSKSAYGLLNDERYSVGTEMGYQISERVNASLWYTYEDIQYEQRSRWRRRNFAAPPATIVIDSVLNDWTAKNEDQVQNLGVRFDFEIVPDRLDASIGYQLQHAVSTAHNDSVPGFQNIPPATTDSGVAVNFPALKDQLQVFDTRLDYHLNEALTFSAGYAYEIFDYQNWHIDGLDPLEPLSRPGETDVFLADRIDQYDAHIVTLSVRYDF